MTTPTLPAPVPTSQLVAADGRTLPLRSAHLDVTAGAGLARTRLVQRFANPHPDPLTVTYQLPLPADGAVAAFAFTIGDRRIQGEIEGRQAARERFEAALAEGHTAALLEQDRTALFAQAIGNIPPGAEVIAELTVDQPLLWLADGQWEYRFPTTVAPRYLGAEGRVPDAARVDIQVTASPLPPRLGLALRIDDHPGERLAPTSPSHELIPAADMVGLAAGAGMDRDLVVRWQAAAAAIGTALAIARPGPGAPHGDEAHGLLTLVPPAAPVPVVPRDLTVLLDTSGSMAGRPLQQAKAILAALIGGLHDQDQLQILEFSTAPRRWQRAPVPATARHRQQALRWLQGLGAGGGTEMHGAVLESLRSLRDGAQAQVLLVTDGLIGFEQEIVRALLQRLPRNCRFHVLGIGAAANRGLSCAAARAGRGVEVIVGLDEDPAAAARRLDQGLRAPVVVDLEVTGTALLGTAPARLPDLFAGLPARLSLRLWPEGGTLLVRGTSASGPFARDLVVPATARGTGRPEIVTRCGRELVEDLEMRAAAEPGREVDQEIEALGLRFGLATRLTSWIAVSSEPTVDPRAPTRRERIPHELPYGMSAEGLGLRSPGLPWPSRPGAPMLSLGSDARATDRLGQAVTPASCHAAVWDSDVQEPRPPRTAVLVLHAPDRIVLELPGADGWILPDEVTLHWRDGAVLRVPVDRARSTRPGAVPAAARIRLSLRLPPSAPPGAPAALEVHGERIAIARQP